MSSRNRLSLRVWFLLFACSFIFVLLATSRGVPVYDEGLILEGADRVAHGAFIHRDFYANYGPAQFVILAAIFKSMGTSVLAERVWDASCRAAVGLLVALIGVHFLPRRRALFAAAVCLTFVTSVGSPGYPIFPALCLILLSVLWLMPVFAGNQSRWRLFSAGLAMGLVTLFRYDVGFFSFLAEALVVCVFLSSVVRKSANWRTVFLGSGSYISGTASVLAPVAILYWAAGALRDFWIEVVSFSAHNYAAVSRLPVPVPDLSTILRLDPPKVLDLTVYFPLLAWIAACLYLVRRFRSHALATVGPERIIGGSLDVEVWTVLLLGAFSICLAPEASVRMSALHMAVPIVLAVLLFFVTASSLTAQQRPWLVLPAGIVVGIFGVLWALSTLLVSGVALTQNISWIASDQAWVRPSSSAQAGSCRPSPGLERLACFVIASDRVAAIEYLQQKTKENEAVFIGVGRHDKIFLNDIVSYFIARRTPATKWYMFAPGMQTTVSTQREIIEELESVKPRFVVLETDWDATMEPNRSAVSSGVVLLDDYIRQHYQIEITFETIHVLKRIQP